MTNLLKVLRETSLEPLHKDWSRLAIPPEPLPQLTVHRFKFSTADIAELAQGVLALGCPGLNFFGCNVGLRIHANDVLNNPFSAREYGC